MATIPENAPEKPADDDLSAPFEWLSTPPIHPNLKPLFNALVLVVTQYEAIQLCYTELRRHGVPTPDEWPNSPALKRMRRDPEFVESHRTELMRDFTGFYRGWCKAIARALREAQSRGVAAIMDAGEPRPVHRWTTRTAIDLDNLAGTLHPVEWGGDGLGLIRCGLPPLPTELRTHAEAVGNRIGDVRAMGVAESAGGASSADAPSGERSRPRAGWEGAAAQLLIKRPEWTVTQVMRHVNVPRTMAYRSPVVVAAIRQRQGEAPPSGQTDGEGGIEAFDD